MSCVFAIKAAFCLSARQPTSWSHGRLPSPPFDSQTAIIFTLGMGIIQDNSQRPADVPNVRVAAGGKVSFDAEDQTLKTPPMSNSPSLLPAGPPVAKARLGSIVAGSLGSGLGSPTYSGGHNHGLNENSHPSHITSDESEVERKTLHILLAVTGSVATIKISQIIGKLRETYREKAEIQLIVTKAAQHFMKGLKIPSDVKVLYDTDEWTSRRGRAESMLHVKLRRWADILLIAPLSANTLAKIVNGICNNLLTSVIRSWNPATPILVAPAMNTLMYTNPMTKKHLQIIKDEYKWIEVLKPVEKVLVCGDMGMGGMREWTDVVHALVSRLGGIEQDDEDEDFDSHHSDDNDE